MGQLVLEGLQRLLWYIQVYEKRFAQEQMERFGLQEKKELTAKRRELDKAKQRVAEIDQLIQKSYEDMTKGLLSEERFATLTVSLENEQRQLKADIPALEDSLNATADKADDLQKFIQRARQVTWLTELTPEIVHEFIDKIVVSKPEKIDGKRHQRVDKHHRSLDSAGAGNAGTGIYGLLSGHAEAQEKDGIAVPHREISLQVAEGWHFFMRCHPSL